MARIDTLGNFLLDVADSIREKTGKTEEITPANYDTEIQSISTGIEPTGTLDIVENGNYNVKEYANANVNVPQESSTVSPKYITFYYYTGTTLDLSWLRTNNMTSFEYMFQYCSKLTTLDLSNFDTSNVTNMAYMFKLSSGSNGPSLTATGLSNFDTSKVQNMSYMFSGCRLVNISDIENWDVSRVTNFRNMFEHSSKANTPLNLSNWNVSGASSLAYMFYNYLYGVSDYKSYSLNLDGLCKSNITNTSYMFSNNAVIECINFDNWDTSNVTNMNNMFSNSNSSIGYDYTKKIDISNFETPKLTSCANMFSNKKLLKELDIRKMTFDNVTSYSGMLYNVPTTCKIIVKDDTQKSWFNTKFPKYTNVVTVAELGA